MLKNATEKNRRRLAWAAGGRCPGPVRPRRCGRVRQRDWGPAAERRWRGNPPTERGPDLTLTCPPAAARRRKVFAAAPAGARWNRSISSSTSLLIAISSPSGKKERLCDDQPDPNQMRSRPRQRNGTARGGQPHAAARGPKRDRTARAAGRGEPACSAAGVLPETAQRDRSPLEAAGRVDSGPSPAARWAACTSCSARPRNWLVPPRPAGRR